MEFQWDEEKNRRNIRKHDVDFLDAARVFHDPRHQTRRDRESPIGEERFQTIGVAMNKLLFVIHTERDGNVIRIISARLAKKSEKRAYLDGTFED